MSNLIKIIMNADQQFIPKTVLLEVVKSLEEGIRKNTNKIDILVKRTESAADKIRSVQELKRELKDFFAINGYSRILNTANIAKKVFSLLSFILLFSACIYYVDENISAFKEYNVVTQVKINEKGSLPFPAVTICLQQRKEINNNSSSVPSNLGDFLNQCYFESSDNVCSINDFERFIVYHPTMDIDLKCFQFNGGRNASNHTTQIRQSKKFGTRTGLTLKLNYSADDYLIYYVSDQKTRPTFTELINYLTPFRLALIGIKKTIDSKLPEPYSPCKKAINSERSHLVKQILEQNLAYRKVYCYDLCLNEYASRRNFNKNYTYNVLDFNYEGNCSQHCPLECDTSIFEITESKLTFVTFNVTQYFEVNFHYSNSKYTTLTQIVKTTDADLVSYTGGLLGLLLELNFLSAYRFFIYVFDLLLV